MAITNVQPLPDVATLVDLERYPIHDLESVEVCELIATWRTEFNDTGACNLPGFIKQEGVASLVAEAKALIPDAHQWSYTRNFLSESEDDPTLPSDHPARIFWTTSTTQLFGNQISRQTGIRQLYEWDALTTFISRIQNKDKLYRFADELEDLNIIAVNNHESVIWHHDRNECTVTLLLQEPEAGGEFVYCRDTLAQDGTVNWEVVSNFLDFVSDLSEPKDVLTPLSTTSPEVNWLERGSGTLTLFRGGHSMHGVLPVQGEQARISAVLTYDSDPTSWSRQRYGAS